MEKENIHFYVEELNALRLLVHSLIGEGVQMPKTEELFAAQMVAEVADFKRLLQDRQLHLNKGAVTFMDHLQAEMCRILEDCNNYALLETHLLTALRKANLDMVITTIGEIFEYLGNDYAHCFNFQMKVPSTLKAKFHFCMVKEWNRLVAKLKNAGIEEELLTVLSGYHQELMSNKVPTFHEMGYWRNMIDGIGKIDFKKNLDLEYALFSQFCYLNFNYPSLIQFCTKKIQRNYNLVDDYREEFIRITIQLRTLRQFYVRSAYGFDTDSSPLTEVLEGILENELLCIKKLLNINKKALTRNGAKFFLRQFYFRISIPIELFLFIFRLMIEKGIILVKRKADLYEFIHSHVGTVKRDNLSIGNMQNSYSENNRRTAIKARALLQTLIAHINEKYISICFIVSLI